MIVCYSVLFIYFFPMIFKKIEDWPCTPVIDTSCGLLHYDTILSGKCYHCFIRKPASTIFHGSFRNDTRLPHYIMYFFFFSRLYNPWWALACFTISFHNLLSLHFSVQFLTFIFFKSSSTWSSHLSLGLPTGLNEHNVIIYFFFSRCYNPWWALACFTISFHNLLSLHFSLSSFSLSSSLNPLLLGQAISILVFLLVLMNIMS